MNALQARMANHGLTPRSIERVMEYIRRHERGEQLFHPADSNPNIGIGDWS